MSNPVRIAMVAEGITDFTVMKAAIGSMLQDRPFILSYLQPESSAFTGGGDAGEYGGGWKGVYKWCLGALERGGGRLSGDPIFINTDILIVHLDADVASENPTAYPIPMPQFAGLLPCEKTCPPPDATTDELRKVLLGWLGETGTPVNTVLCTPSKNIEAWVVALFFPTDREMKRYGAECHPDPASRLAQQPKKVRFDKSRAEYEQRLPQIQAGWPAISTTLSEAGRFESDFIAVVQSLPD